MPLTQGRKRRSQPDADAEHEASPEPASQRRRMGGHERDAEGSYGDDDGAMQSSDSLDTMVKKLVRLALACEYQRKPIRRQDISEKVLGSAGRQFKTVFAQAQLQLRSVFGMEMAELPAREKVTLAQKRAAKSQSQTSKPTVSYILISVLPSKFHDPEVLQPPSAPTVAEESKYVAIYTLLVSLVTLSGGSLPEAKMKRYLRRVNMEDTTSVAGYQKTEQLLKRMEREGYINKIREPTGAGEEDIYWTVGPRGKVEVGDEAVRSMARAVYGDLDEEAERDLDRRLERSLAIGEKVVPKERNAEPKKKCGRRRKDEHGEEEGDAEEEEESD
ncbi:hypothetical protein BAUCODRAFT_29131 [Baudoinia panamericana UAMH 10762]|uniref:MAGE domain-containing protein n=1 Tax=Baudoinia panamericana (strain UAMH 10762) TaxID=717646 RepID=M2MUZ1_BAUPA|nr:uncharacterized protein BAUCODRAFT_29131 [Baudoinia panamericana UAMH 10762]EMD00767.1 hypothetical protein BAUCODRAFT_29131 [Baudoinia panamericana UAMH 10762]